MKSPALTDYLAAVADAHHQHHEAVVLERRGDPVMPDRVAPQTFAVASQRMADAARVLRSSNALAQIAQHPPLGLDAELAQVAGSGANEFDAPGRRHQGLARRFRSR